MVQLSRRVTSASLITIIGSVLQTVITIVIQSFIGRTGGSIALGKYTTALMVVQFLATLIVFGTPSAVAKQASSLLSIGKTQEARSLLNSLLAFLISSAVIVGVIILMLLTLFGRVPILDVELPRTEMVLIIFGGLALSLSKSASAFYHANFDNIKAVFVTLMTWITIAVLVILSYRSFYNLNIVQVVSSGFIVGAILAFILLLRDRHLPATLSRSDLQGLLKFSMPLFGVSLVAFFSTWLDRLLIGITNGVADIGLLTGAVVIVRAIRFFPQVLTPVLLTTYSHVKSSPSYSKRLSEAFSIDLFFVSLFSLGSATVVYIVAQPITLLLWGSNFDNIVTTILRIELIGVMGLAYSLQTPNFLIVVGRPELNLHLAVVHVLLQFVLSIPLLMQFGVLGLAAATSTSMIIMAIVRHMTIVYKLGVGLNVRSTSHLILASIIATATYHVLVQVRALPPTVSMIIGLGIAASLFILALFRNRPAVEIIKSLVKQV